ncbi:unnamed protein product [Heligmosomoides polygyrus]|uniref:Uncharacterized protein n=1 Tax=Heligmosomoides polygyrus TaxID=6339 RepID=A0A183FYV5_HELPZ|nr:unnamed protein product [Heligmosomoides polygyrus]
MSPQHRATTTKFRFSHQEEKAAKLKKGSLRTTCPMGKDASGNYQLTSDIAKLCREKDNGKGPTATSTCHLPQDGCGVPSVLPSEIRHAISSVKKRTAPGSDRIKPEPGSSVGTASQLYIEQRTVQLRPKWTKGCRLDDANGQLQLFLRTLYERYDKIRLLSGKQSLYEGFHKHLLEQK